VPNDDVKILVPTKRVPSTDERIRIQPDGSGIEDAALVHIINPFDAIALEEALHIRECRGSEVEVTAVGIGNADFESELRTALAMGADRAVRVDFEGTLDPWSVAQVLAAMARREKPDLVLMGKQAVDDDSNQTGQMLSGLLDWPQATFASKIEFVEPARISVARETDRGLETVVVRLPAVVTTDLRLNEPRYASLPALMKAKKRPIETISHRDLDVSPEPKVRIVRLEQVAIERKCVHVADAAELVHRLRCEAKVI
jgi:electron transfer flavoprotein beta subunit